MFWKLIGRNIFYPLAISLVIILWFLTTESGSKTSIYCLKNIVPGELNIENVKGTWINSLTFKKLKYENPKLKLFIAELHFTPNIKSLANALIEVPSITLENVSFVWKEKTDYPLFIKNGVGQFRTTFNRRALSIHIQNLKGSWLDMPLDVETTLNIVDNHFQIPTGELVLGENKINITESTYSRNQLNCIINLNVPEKKMKAQFNGYFLRQQKQHNWSGKMNIALQNNTASFQLKSDFYYGVNGLNANIYLPSWFLPKQALTFKNLHLNISGKIENPLLVKGSGYSGTGKFEVNGTLKLAQDEKLFLNFHGENLQLYNTRNVQMIGSPELSLHFKNNTLFVDGTLLVHKAFVTLQDQKNVSLLSKDVVLIDSATTHPSNSEFKIVPNIYVVIENKLYFDGYGINATVGGKLTVSERPDGLLTGEGKLTIKEGKYRLQGATRYIHKGHLLFPPGTLLKDPLLDILISQNRVQQQGDTNNTNVGIYVQGTLQHPIYQPYSNDSNLKSADILSRLGFGQSETAGDENQRQLLSQTAFLFSGTANPFVDFLQKNLNLEEFNLESKPTNKTLSTQGGADTVLVIGKSLSQKLYLQYLQSIMEPVATIRLKYFLSRFFTVSAETGTEGLGSDLIFSMEKN